MTTYIYDATGRVVVKANDRVTVRSNYGTAKSGDYGTVRSVERPHSGRVPLSLSRVVVDMDNGATIHTTASDVVVAGYYFDESETTETTVVEPETTYTRVDANVGDTVYLDDEPWTVVGIMAQGAATGTNTRVTLKRDGAYRSVVTSGATVTRADIAAAMERDTANDHPHYPASWLKPYDGHVFVATVNAPGHHTHRAVIGIYATRAGADMAARESMSHYPAIVAACPNDAGYRVGAYPVHGR